MSKVTVHSLEKLKKRFNIKDKTIKSDSIADLDSEAQSEYCFGGYCPVQVSKYFGEKNRYIVVQKLGWGYFSTVWLAYDYETESFVAMKFQKANEACRAAAMDEIKINLALKNATAVVRLIDHFFTFSENGKHVVMVFEVVGDNLLSLIRSRDYKGLPLGQVKLITKDILTGLLQAHKAQIIHTDLKPENILFTILPQKVHQTINTWKPPPRNGIPLLERTDLSTLTKSQQRRLKRKLRQREEQGLVNQDEHNSRSDKVTTKAAIDDCTVEDSNKRMEQTNDSTIHNSILTPESSDRTPSQDRSCASIVNTNNDTTSQNLNSTKIEESSSLPNSNSHSVKIADFGNACWVDEHFSEDIQTRQYKSPETLIQAGYDTASDIWSVACVIFELATGNFLFQPRESKKGLFSQDEDHLALMIEYIGDFSLEQIKHGKKSPKYFDTEGSLRHITKLNRTSIAEVLTSKYKIDPKEAKQFQDFLLPMLVFDPKERSTASQMLQHPWLQDADESLDEDMMKALDSWMTSKKQTKSPKEVTAKVSNTPSKSK